MARKATEKHESMVHSIEAAPIAAKHAHARRPRPAPNRTETVPSRTAPHRIVPCRVPFPQTHSRLRPRVDSNRRSDGLRPNAITTTPLARVTPDALQKHTLCALLK
eukprot:6304269-Prymnesium_polylepis.1